MNVFLSLLFLAAIAQSQFFDPVVDDKTYLDRIEEQIHVAVETSAHQLIQRTKAAEKVTKSYISTKLKDNVFKVLRTLAEMEEVAFQENLNKAVRAGRQEAAESSGSSGGGDTETVDSEQSEGGDDDAGTEKPTTPLNGLSTAVKINQNVFQFIGEAIKTIFKGVTGKKNFVRESENNEKQKESSSSSLVQALPTLMKKPYADQLIGILALLTNENKETEFIVLNKESKVQQSPFERLFSGRGHASSTFARNSDDEETTTAVITYIETLKKNHPLLFPDLYRGIPEARRLLDSMSRVVAGINRDEIDS